MRRLRVPLLAGVVACSACIQPRSRVQAQQMPQSRPSVSSGNMPGDVQTQGLRCGGTDGCLLFDSPRGAFAHVLEANPRIIGIGEFHAKKGYETLVSATRHFTQELLPMLQGRASDLVVEFWIPPVNCGHSEKEVRQKQEPVTQQQAEKAPNEFVGLAQEAKRLGITPQPLRIECEDYVRIMLAGEESVRRMLELNAQLLGAGARRRYERNQADGSDKMIVTYGGAMHNDIAPDHSCGEPCSFGEKLNVATGGRYIELDLVIPEYVTDEEFWKARTWYSRFHKQGDSQTMLLHPRPNSYVLFFPVSAGWQKGGTTDGLDGGARD